MSNIILSSEDMYKAFLRGIRKSNTSVILPAYWNPFINEVQLQWVKSKLPMVEFSQKRIDDLAPLRVVTDGGTMTNSYDPITAEHPGVFLIPIDYYEISRGYPIAAMPNEKEDLPLYLHGLNVMVRLNSGTWKPCKIRKSDKTVMLDENPYRVPSANRIYFERIKNQIHIIGGSLENKLRLEYIRYPKTINYSTSIQSNIDPELQPSQNQEVTDMAIRTYLERIMDPRYKSFLQEEMIKSQGQ